MNKYRIFIKAADIGNITKTAEALNYTQSGVSYAIASLEDEIGFPLFKRHKKGIELTAKGRHFYPFVLDLVNAEQRLSQAIDGMKNRIAGDLRLGCFPSAASRWVPKIMRVFSEKYPDVRFHLTDGDYEELAGLVREERLDCSFIPSTQAAGLDFLPLYEDPVYAVLAPSHELAKKESVTIEEFLESPLIASSKGYASVINDLLAEHGKEVFAKYVLQDDTSIMHLAAEGLGVGVMPGLMVSLCSADVVFKPFDPPYCRQLGIVTPRGQRLSAVTATFIDFVKGIDLYRL